MGIRYQPVPPTHGDNTTSNGRWTRRALHHQPAVTGIFDTGTDVAALRRWQTIVGVRSSEVADAGTWKLLATGVRSAS